MTRWSRSIRSSLDEPGEPTVRLAPPLRHPVDSTRTRGMTSRVSHRYAAVEGREQRAAGILRPFCDDFDPAVLEVGR